MSVCPQCGSRLPWAVQPSAPPAATGFTSGHQAPTNQSSGVKFLPPNAPAPRTTPASAAYLSRPTISFGWIFAVIVIGGVGMAWYLFSPMLQKKEYAYDVAFMMGKGVDTNQDGVDINEIQAFLMDSPLEKDKEEDKKSGSEYSEAAWQKKTGSLLVTYRRADKKVLRFFLPTNNPTGVTADKDSLLALGNLKEDDPDYVVRPVPAVGDPKYFTGVQVIPRSMVGLSDAQLAGVLAQNQIVLPKACQVTYRISGRSRGVRGEFDITPGQSTSIPLTVPDSTTGGNGYRAVPWDTTFEMNLKPGDSLHLSADNIYYDDPTPTLEILVDGEVVASNEGKYGKSDFAVARCTAQGCD